MKQKEVFKKIGGIIKELNDQYEYLQTVTDDLNDLELELFVSNAHFLTDHIEILRKLDIQNKWANQPQVIKPEVPHEQKFFEPVVQHTKPTPFAKEEKPPVAIEKPVKNETIKFDVEQPITQIDEDPETHKDNYPSTPEEPETIKFETDRPVAHIDLSSGMADDTYSYIREEPETIRHELILDEATNWEDDEELPVAHEPAKPSKRKKHEPEAMAEEPAATVEHEEGVIDEKVAEEPVKKTDEDEVLTINQKMSSKLADKTEQLAIKPISDIKVAITLNDKLLYVKDLFNGYNLAYSEAIEILNRFNTFEEAARFLKTNYVVKNNWEGKPATTEKFYALLRRRYA